MTDTTQYIMSPPLTNLKDHMEPYQTWMIGILSLVIVIGIPGNLLVFSVYFSKSKKSSTNMLILSMAVLDCCIALFSIARMLHWIYESSYETAYKCQVYRVLGSWSEFFSAFMTTTIAVDRYFQICRPHFPMTAMKAVLCSLMGLGISNLFSVPVAFLYGVKDNKCQIIKNGLALYIPLTLAFAVFILLMVTALVLYVLVYLEVRQRFRNRVGSSIFIRPNESAFVESDRVQTTSVTRVAPAMDDPCKGNSWTRGTATNADRQRYGAARDSTVSVIESESCSRRASEPYLTVKVSGESDGRETVEAEHSKTAVEKHETVISKVTTDMRNQAVSMTTRLENFDNNYKDLMTAIIKTNVPTQGIKTRPESATNPELLRPESRAGSHISRSSGRTGRMLLLATFVFVGTWTARCIMWLITNIESEWWENLRFSNVHGYAFLTILQHVYYTTPAVNPIIYSFANPRFRSDSVKMLKAVRLWHKKVFPG